MAAISDLVFSDDFNRADGAAGAPWQVVDFGGLVDAGISSNQFRIKSDGDFWQTADDAAGLFKALSSKQRFRVEVDIVGGALRNFPRLLQIRESLNANSKIVALLTGSNDFLLRTIHRATTGGNPTHNTSPTQLISLGDTIGFELDEGTLAWLHNGTAVHSFSIGWTPGFVGLTSSAAGSTPGYDTFDNFREYASAPLVALKCNDNRANANVANSASDDTFILKDNSGNVNTADRSQPAAETPFNDRHFALTGDDRVTGALNWAAATEMTAGGYFGSNQINTLGAQLFILDTDPVSSDYAVSVSSDDGSLTGGGRLRVIIKASNGTSLVDIVTNDRIFIDALMHFVVITYDQTNGCRVFVDGSEQTLTGTNTVGTIRSVTDGTLQLGSRENGTNPANTSKHYNFKLYDRLLSAAEQTAWMAESGVSGLELGQDLALPLQYDLDDPRLPRLMKLRT